METFDFDQLFDRRSQASAKWNMYPADVLPMWVADMDFRSPPAVTAALRAKVEDQLFGYQWPDVALADAIRAWLLRLYGWEVERDQIVYIPSIVVGFNIACRAYAQPGDEVLMHTPVYMPFNSAPANHGQTALQVKLKEVVDGQMISYAIDWEATEAAITPKTKLFLLCSPHNPTGQMYTRADLTRLAELCLQHKIVICSDEIHSDLVIGDEPHIPTATLSPAIADQTVTLMAPSKTFNLPGLGCGFAIITNPELRKAYEAAKLGMVPYVNMLGQVAALAAYRDGEPWLTALRGYLRANRDLLTSVMRQDFPDVPFTIPAATYMTWIDFRSLFAAREIADSPYKYFMERAKVATNDGAAFGPGGEGFVRLNFACPRSRLVEGLEKLKEALG